MLYRFTRVRHEFGNKDFAKVVFLLVSLVAMAVIGYFAFDSLLTVAVAAVGLILGWFLRTKIVDHMETLFRLAPKFLFIYGIALTAGQLLGLSREAQLLIITATTAALFNIQFWTLSDPAIINIERAKLEQ